MSDRSVRVAIVDSGVEAAHPAFSAGNVESFGVVQKGASFVVERSAPGDGSGHGTACAGIVRRLAPFANLVSVRALSPEGRGSREALVAALRFCIGEGIEVVNLSLGVDLPKSSPVRPTDAKTLLDLYELADEAFVRGVILVAAGPNHASFRTYPSRAKSLIGVGRGAFSDAERLELAPSVDFEILAAGLDVSAPALPSGERRWSGTSFACPHVSGHVARIVARLGTTEVLRVRTELHRLARPSEAEAYRETA